MNEKSVIKALQRGDVQALEVVIDLYASYVSTVIHNIIGTHMTKEDVEEAASDVFYTLWNNSDNLIPGKLKPYLGSIARSKAKNKLRELDKTVTLEEDWIITSDRTPDAIIEAKEQTHAIRGTLEALAPEDKEIFIRHYYYYQTVAEIEAETGIKASTVKSKLKRGREKLKYILYERGVFL